MDKVCDMKYKMMDSPLGKIELSGCEQGLHGIKLHGRKGADTEGEEGEADRCFLTVIQSVPVSGPVEAPAPPELLGGPEDVAEPLMQCAAWLDAYFHKPALLTELPLPALHHPVFQQDSFTRQVLWKLLKVVKFGEMISYQQLAALAGNPKAARAVGGAMRNNPVPILIPCHRVICSSGAVGNYSGGLGVKEWLLAHEGSLVEGPSRGGGSRLARSWRGALGGTTSSQPAGRN
ncbi:methylated-DNA--protein-cysteine methyltransferase isoform X3 [Equus caballus]